MKMQTTIAIDAMGGDVGPAVTIPATLIFLAQSPDCRALLKARVGDEVNLPTPDGVRLLNVISVDYPKPNAAKLGADTPSAG